MNKLSVIIAAAAAIGLSTGGGAQMTGSTGSGTPVGPDSKAAAMTNQSASRPAPTSTPKAKKKAKKASQGGSTTGGPATR